MNNFLHSIVPNMTTVLWQELKREIRTHDAKLLAVAVMLAVTALAGVGFFTQHLQMTMAQNAKAMLGGDVVVSSDNPLPDFFVQQAQQQGLQQASSQSFMSMARTIDTNTGIEPKTALVAIKSVDSAYPLRGGVQTEGEDVHIQTEKAPQPGTVWVEKSVLLSLGKKLGEKIALGDATFIIAKTIIQEPDKGLNFAQMAPRVLMHESDLSNTGLVQPASRIRYRLALASDDVWAVERYQKTIEKHLGEGKNTGTRLETTATGRPEVAQLLNRAERFFGIINSLTLFLVAIAMALVAHQFAKNHRKNCALRRVFGQSQIAIFRQYASIVVLLGTLGSAIGVIFGYGVYTILLEVMSGALMLPTSTSTVFSWTEQWFVALRVAAQSSLVGIGLLLSFGLPSVVGLAHTPPLYVLRQDAVSATHALRWSHWLGWCTAIALLLWAVGADSTAGFNASLAIGSFLGLLVTSALLGSSTAGVLWVIQFISQRQIKCLFMAKKNPFWRLIVRQFTANRSLVLMQTTAVALGLMALTTLTLFHTDVLQNWQNQHTDHAPNRFSINIMPNQRAAFEAHLNTQGAKIKDTYPMLRARLVGINQQPIDKNKYPNERAKRLLDREFNISHTSSLPDSNEVVAGKWITAPPTMTLALPAHNNSNPLDGISIEEGLATTLNINLNDVLSFDFAGISAPYMAKVTSIRKVDWGSLRANFFVLLPTDTLPPSLLGVASTHMIAFRAIDTTHEPLINLNSKTLPNSLKIPKNNFDADLATAFPNVTTLDLNAIQIQLQNWLGHIVQAIQLLFGLTVMVSGLVVMVALHATQKQRQKALQLMCSLGASSKLLNQMQLVEWLVSGGLAGTLAGIFANVIAMGLSIWVLDVAWHTNFIAILCTGFAGAALTCLLGYLHVRRTVHKFSAARMR